MDYSCTMNVNEHGVPVQNILQCDIVWQILLRIVFSNFYLVCRFSLRKRRISWLLCNLGWWRAFAHQFATVALKMGLATFFHVGAAMCFNRSVFATEWALAKLAVANDFYYAIFAIVNWTTFLLGKWLGSDCRRHWFHVTFSCSHRTEPNIYRCWRVT